MILKAQTHKDIRSFVLGLAHGFDFLHDAGEFLLEGEKRYLSIKNVSVILFDRYNEESINLSS
jgi:hypothetical protein